MNSYWRWLLNSPGVEGHKCDMKYMNHIIGNTFKVFFWAKQLHPECSVAISTTETMQQSWVWTLSWWVPEGNLFALWYHHYVVALFFAWKPHLVFDNRIRLLWILPNDKKKSCNNSNKSLLCVGTLPQSTPKVNPKHFSSETPTVLWKRRVDGKFSTFQRPKWVAEILHILCLL